MREDVTEEEGCYVTIIVGFKNGEDVPYENVNSWQISDSYLYIEQGETKDILLNTVIIPLSNIMTAEVRMYKEDD